jgi:hypothetical protein
VTRIPGVTNQESTLTPLVSHPEPLSTRGRPSLRLAKWGIVHGRFLSNPLKIKETDAREATHNFVVDTHAVTEGGGPSDSLMVLRSF